jgi:hypothetical protein
VKTVLSSLIVCVALAGLTGCRSTPTQEQLANADYGKPMEKSTAVHIAESWLTGVLKDPESARHNWNTFDKGWVRKRWLSGEFLFGYVLKGTVNAKNSFGGYSGPRRYVFLFNDGSLVGVWGEEKAQGGAGRSFMMRLQ